MPGKPLDVTDSTFDTEVLKSEQPVLVDFWAPWCPPCRMVGPMVEDLASRMQGRLKVCKVNVDDNPTVAQTYAIRAVPTLLVFKNGALVDRLVGAMPKEMLLQKLKPHQ